MAKKKRILFGAVDIGWRIEHYTKFIQENFGDELIAESFVKFKLPEKHYKTNYTYVVQHHKYPKIIQWCISFVFFVYALFKYDIFYFLSAENILTRKLMPLEFWIYKVLGKKIVMHFVGTDIRNPELLYWRNDNTEDYLNKENKQSPPLQKEWQIRICKIAEKYAAIILVSTPDLLTFFNKKTKVKLLPVFLNIKQFEDDINRIQLNSPYEGKKETITVLHAPSNPNVKGTKFIKTVLDEIVNEFDDVEIIVTTNQEFKKMIQSPYTVTKYELMKLYLQSDIVIDQVLIGWYGLQSVECLYLNKETICYIDNELYKYLKPDCPIYSCQKLLKQSIIQAIKNVKSNTHHINNKQYVLQYHTIENSNFKKIINELI